MMRWQDSRGNQREVRFAVNVEDMGIPIGLQQRRLSDVSEESYGSLYVNLASRGFELARRRRTSQLRQDSDANLLAIDISEEMKKQEKLPNELKPAFYSVD